MKLVFSTKVKNFLCFFIPLLVLALILWIWFYPQKLQTIISFEQEPSILYVNNACRFVDYEETVSFSIREHFESLWCIKSHEKQLGFHPGDLLFVYQDFKVVITSRRGYAYSLQDHTHYQLLDREKIHKIWTLLNEKQAVRYAS